MGPAPRGSRDAFRPATERASLRPLLRPPGGAFHKVPVRIGRLKPGKPKGDGPLSVLIELRLYSQKSHSRAPARADVPQSSWIGRAVLAKLKLLAWRLVADVETQSASPIGDGDAPEIDKAIAASAIAGYVGGAKMLKTLKGNVDTQDPVVFEAQYEKYRKSHTDTENNVDEVPGFVDRSEKQPIKLRLPGKNSNRQLVTAATVEAAVHETMHLNSSTSFQQNFGHPYNEGVTDNFAEVVLGSSGKAYRDQLELAKGLIAGA